MPRPKPAQDANAAAPLLAFQSFSASSPCLLGAGHEILYVAKRLRVCRMTSCHSLFSYRAP